MKHKRPDNLGAAAGDDSEPVCVAVVTSRTEAELIVGMLRSGGLRAAMSARSIRERQPDLRLRSVQVLVPRADEAAARECLAAVEDNPAD
jgi:hypothetical protein